MHTPWGYSDHVEYLAPGILSVSTPSHGGIHLDNLRNVQVPEYMRREDGWYEEDMEWAIPAMVFPSVFPTETRTNAERTFRNYYPYSWEAFHNRKLAAGESVARDERNFLTSHQEDWLVISAMGDWEDGVPKGFVRVCATKGGHCEPGVEKAYFLVPVAEYRAARKSSFIIQPHHTRTLDPAIVNISVA